MQFAQTEAERIEAGAREVEATGQPVHVGMTDVGRAFRQVARELMGAVEQGADRAMTAKPERAGDGRTTDTTKPKARKPKRDVSMPVMRHVWSAALWTFGQVVRLAGKISTR